MAMEIRGLKNSELDEHADSVYLSYSHDRQLVSGAMLTHQDWWLQGIARNPYYETEQTRVMVLDGKLVSSVTCYLRPSYIAGRIVKAVCIGSVCTHPNYRRQGLGIQWVPGAGNPPQAQWTELLLQIQEAGKNLHISASPEEVKHLHGILKPELVFYDTWARNEKEADALIQWFIKHSS